MTTTNTYPFAANSWLIKPLVISAFLALIGFSATGQSIDRYIIGSAGNTRNATNFSADWTIGETVVQTLSNQNFILTQGFHQVEWVVLETPQLVAPSIEFSLFPNPASTFVWVKPATSFEGRVQLFSLHGQLVRSLELSVNAATEISLAGLENSQYLVIITDNDGNLIKTFNLIKSY